MCEDDNAHMTGGKGVLVDEPDGVVAYDAEGVRGCGDADGATVVEAGGVSVADEDATVSRTATVYTRASWTASVCASTSAIRLRRCHSERVVLRRRDRDSALERGPRRRHQRPRRRRRRRRLRDRRRARARHGRRDDYGGSRERDGVPVCDADDVPLREDDGVSVCAGEGVCVSDADGVTLCGSRDCVAVTVPEGPRVSYTDDARSLRGSAGLSRATTTAVAVNDDGVVTTKKPAVFVSQTTSASASWCSTECRAHVTVAGSPALTLCA